MTNIKYHLHLFDGDGGVASGVATGDANVSMPSGESQPRVEYGKDVNTQGNSQFGTDEGGASAPTPNLDAEFDELIKGKYKDQFGARVSERIQDRFKNSRDYEGQVARLNEAVAPLMAMYGLEANDIEGLKNAINGDDSLYQARADERGVTTEMFRENLYLQMDAQLGQAYRENLAREQERQEQFARWDQEADMLRANGIPGLDMNEEVKNPAFMEALNKTGSVKDAFILTHYGDMLSDSNAKSQMNATQNAVNNFRERAARPVEAALKPQPAIVRKTDPSKFTDEDLTEIARRVYNGEKISL